MPEGTSLVLIEVSGEALPVAKGSALSQSILSLSHELAAAPPHTLSAICAAYVYHLDGLRQIMSLEQWRRSGVPWLRTLPSHDVVMQDPLTARAMNKPRHYAGDAVMIDLIYKHSSVLPLVSASSERGQAIYDYASEDHASRCVRRRRDCIAARLRSLSARRAHVLSIGAGHLRELDLVPVSADRHVTAIDSDRRSLRAVRRRFEPSHVTTLHANIDALVAGWKPGQNYDFIYASGLYDYLELPIAQKLTGRLHDLLAPGGELLIANLSDDLVSQAYMEAHMDWWLVYRSTADMRALAAGIDDTELAGVDITTDAEGALHYLHLTRR